MVIISIIGTSNRKTPPSIDNNLYNKMIEKCREIIDSFEDQFSHSDITLISGGASFSDHVAVSLYLLDQDYKKLILYIPCDWDNDNMKYVDSTPTPTTSIPLTSDTNSITTRTIPSHTVVKKQQLLNSTITSKPVSNSTSITSNSTITSSNSTTTTTSSSNNIELRKPYNVLNYYHRQFSAIIQSNSLEQIKMALSIGAEINNEYPGFFNRDNVVARRSDIMIAFSWSKTGFPTEGGTHYTWKKTNSKCKKIHVSLHDL